MRTTYAEKGAICAEETERLFTKYSLLTAKINVSANNIAASEKCAGDIFNGLGNCFYADNKALSSGIIDWDEVYNKYHSGKRGKGRGDS